MKTSKFIVSQKSKNPGMVLLYSTFTTSIVEVEDEIYNDIFCEETLQVIQTKPPHFMRWDF